MRSDEERPQTERACSRMHGYGFSSNQADGANADATERQRSRWEIIVERRDPRDLPQPTIKHATAYTTHRKPQHPTVSRHHSPDRACQGIHGMVGAPQSPNPGSRPVRIIGHTCRPPEHPKQLRPANHHLQRFTGRILTAFASIATLLAVGGSDAQQPFGTCSGRLVILADDQYGVISGDGTEHIVKRLSIHDAGHILRRS